ncbi:MAG: hypothetical protein DMF77_13915 [Acidobacteria bacterium]|nr:MAG: hypothetical protein DMF77_13915 [Acidobacteriota bacterium]
MKSSGVGHTRYRGAIVASTRATAAARAHPGEARVRSSRYASTSVRPRASALVTRSPRVPIKATSGAAATGYVNAFAK